MPSSAFNQFKNRRHSEILEIASIFDNMNDRPGPNRYYGLLNGALVLLVSSWEIYCEEVCQQAADRISNRANLVFSSLPVRARKDILVYAGSNFGGNRDPFDEKIALLPDGGWKELIKERIAGYISDFNTPKFTRQRAKDLNGLFRHVLGIRMSQEINNFVEEQGFCEKLDAVVTLRGEIAHTGGAAPENRLTSPLLREHSRLFVEAAAAVEAILHREFRENLEFVPWQITRAVRESLRPLAAAKL